MFDDSKKDTSSTLVDGTAKKDTSSISLDEVAKKAGVSKMTVSRVLRNKTGVSEKTRKKVLEAVQEVNYVPNRLAAAFGTGNTSTLVGISVPTLSRDLFSQILEGIEKRLQSVGYQPLIGTTNYSPESENDWIKTILSWKPCGVMILGNDSSTQTWEMLQRSNVSVIKVWDTHNINDFSHSVGFDHFKAGYEMGEYLSQRYSGQFAYVGCQIEDHYLGKNRLLGYEQALSHAKSTDAKPLVTYFLNDRPSFYAGYYGTEQILSKHPDTRIIYYLDDNMAVGGIFYCQSKGIKIPGDIAIAGFGGLSISSVLTSPITTTKVPRLKIGQLAAKTMLKLITEQEVEKHQETETELVKGMTA